MNKVTALIIAIVLVLLYFVISLVNIPYKGVFQIITIIGIAIFISKVIKKK